MLDRLAVDVGHAECESDDFSLSTLRKDEKDRLGNTVKEILWIEKDYAVYCSDKGIYVQFSDCPQQRKVQRSQFTKIVPELCELRYLTAQMRRRNPLRHSSEPRHTLYDHNMAQALMLAMEGEAPRAKQLAELNS